MKKNISLMILVISMCLSAKMPTAERMQFYYASTRGANVLEYMHIVDQDGNPVEGAKLRGSLSTGDGMNDFIPIENQTDTNGEFVVKGKCTDCFVLQITKDGYYKTSYKISYRATKSSPKVADGKWQPYGTHRTIVLNKIINPQPLYHHDALESFKIPVRDEWIGFDCEKYDFVAPFGKGVEKDMLLRFTLRNPSIEEWHVSMEVSFTNSPLAGAYEMPLMRKSEFQSVYHADTNVFYKQSFLARCDRTPQKSFTYDGELSEDKYLVFRVRTKVDAKGKIVSAHYGKIYGPWEFVGLGEMSMQAMMFNPIPNDTNLESMYEADISRRAQKNREYVRGKKKRNKKKRKTN